MKNLIKLFGIIALVAVIGFGVTSCKDDEGEDTYRYFKDPSVTNAEALNLVKSLYSLTNAGDSNVQSGITKAQADESVGNRWEAGNLSLEQITTKLTADADLTEVNKTLILNTLNSNGVVGFAKLKDASTAIVIVIKKN